MSSRHESLALQVARESGKPLRDARIEVDRAIDCVQVAISVLRSDGGHVIPMGLNTTSAGRLAFTQYEPIAPQAKISRLELFGPTIAVYSYSDMDEAIARLPPSGRDGGHGE